MTTTAVEPRTSLLSQPHHDGSEAYAVEQPARLGDEAVVRIRLPHEASADTVALRYVRDGEPRVVRAELDEQTERESWWRAQFPVANPVTRYRWLLAGGAVGYAWVNGRGALPHDAPDADDFVLTLDRGGPDWHLGSVVYEIFPDRFASSRLVHEPPAWAVPRAWDDLPTGRGPETPFEWFGGDLRGIEQQLDHVESLGVSALYLTPIFPAGSTHRYDASSFERVDPLLGGDDAFASLLGALHGRGMRLIGDLTTNHTGDGHEWFVAARAGGRERELYYFDEAIPGGYESWLGVHTLPKLDWRSAELRARVGTVLRRWLDAGLDGWRIDVANMTGRFGEVDVNREAVAALRDAVGDALLVAEHNYDFRPDFAGWHGTMNYAGFTRPVWWWLRGDDFGEDLFVADMPAPRYRGGEAVAAMRSFRAGLPWQTVLHSWNLLDSHDSARFRTVTSSRERHVVGIGLQMTMPGVPMVFAGDEVGLEGEWGEDARRTIPWTRRDAWDGVLLEEYRRLIALRRGSAALARGGMRFVHVGDDEIAYLRETPAERLLALAARAPHEPVRLPLAALGAGELETLYGGDAAHDGGDVVLPADGPAFHLWRIA